MKQWYVNKNGDDGNDGEFEHSAKLTLAGVAAVLSATEHNIVNIGEGTYDESTDFSGYEVSLIGVPYIPCGLGTGVYLEDSGAGAHVLKIGEHSKVSGVVIIARSNQIGLDVDGQDYLPMYLDNVAIYVAEASAIGLRVDVNMLMVSNLFLIAYPTASLADSYLVQLAGAGVAYPWYFKDAYFVFDSTHPSYPFPEARIWKDDVPGGSNVKPCNCVYCDVPILHGGTGMDILTTPDTYPSQSAIKDPRPVRGWAGHELVPLIRLYDRDVEADGSEVADKTTLDAIETDTDEIQGKLPNNYIMGSSDQTDKDDEIDAILADTDAIDARLPTDPADQSLVEAAISTAESNIRGTDDDDLKTISGQIDSTQANVTDVLADTDEIQGKLPNNYIMGSSDQANVDEDIDAVLADTDEIQGKLPTDYIMGSAVIASQNSKLDDIKTAIDSYLDAAISSRATAAVCSEARLAELDAANVPADIDSLITRLTAVRASYLDNLSGGAAALASVCSEARLGELGATNIPADIDTLKTRLSEERVANLDNLTDLVTRSLGIVGENQYIDNYVYTDGKLTSSRLRIYSDPASVGTDSDVVATYTITAAWGVSGLTTMGIVKA